jgi:biopolymer transport protein ExbD
MLKDKNLRTSSTQKMGTVIPLNGIILALYLIFCITMFVWILVLKSINIPKSWNHKKKVEVGILSVEE